VGADACPGRQPESLNYQLRKVTRARGDFPGDDAVVKLLWLAIVNIVDRRARERAARKGSGKRADQPVRLMKARRSSAGARPSPRSTRHSLDGCVRITSSRE
jgi:hypothetical protein